MLTPFPLRAGREDSRLLTRFVPEASPVIGDHYRAPLTWRNEADLGLEPGRPVVLGSRLDRANLHGVELG